MQSSVGTDFYVVPSNLRVLVGRHSSAGGECVPSLHVHGVFSLAKLQCHWDAGANLTLYGCSLKVGVV